MARACTGNHSAVCTVLYKTLAHDSRAVARVVISWQHMELTSPTSHRPLLPCSAL